MGLGSWGWFGPRWFVADRSRAVVLVRFSVACFGVTVSVAFHLVFVHIIFSSVLVAGWPPYWKELLTRLDKCSLCVLTLCNFSCFPFWF